jgi:dCMP deaminase
MSRHHLGLPGSNLPQVPRNWDQRMLHMARQVAAWSKDPGTKVGAVAVRDRRILATGYNGLPAGVHDSRERTTDRELKLAMTVHAEANLVAFAARSGACLAGSTCYIWPLPACSQCAALLIQADIARIIVPDFPEPLRWAESFQLGKVMLSEASVILERIPMVGPVGHELHAPDFSEQQERLEALNQPLIPDIPPA